MFDVESRSPQLVVTIFWCSTEPSGSVIVLFAVVACKKRFVFAGVYPVFLRFVDL